MIGAIPLFRERISPAQPLGGSSSATGEEAFLASPERALLIEGREQPRAGGVQATRRADRHVMGESVRVILTVAAAAATVTVLLWR